MTVHETPICLIHAFLCKQLPWTSKEPKKKKKKWVKKRDTSCKQEMVEQTFQCLGRKVMIAEYPEAKASV